MKRSKTTWLAWSMLAAMGIAIAFWPTELCDVFDVPKCALSELNNAGYSNRSLGLAIVCAAGLAFLLDQRFPLIKTRAWIESSIAAVIAAVFSLMFMPVDTWLDLLLTALVIVLSATACLAASQEITEGWLRRKERAVDSNRPHPLECAGPDARPLKAGEYVIAAALVGAALIQGKARR